MLACSEAPARRERRMSRMVRNWGAHSGHFLGYYHDNPGYYHEDPEDQSKGMLACSEAPARRERRISRMVRNWGAQSGHSRSLSPRARALKLCPHMKCTAGSSSALPLSAHRLFWNTRACSQPPLSTPCLYFPPNQGISSQNLDTFFEHPLPGRYSSKTLNTTNALGQ